MDDRTTTTPAQTSSTQSTTTPTSGGAMGSPSGLRPGGGTANVQLRQSLRGMDYTEQATQLKPADQGAGVQMMRRSGAVQRAPAQGAQGDDAPTQVVQRRAVQRLETPPVTTPVTEGTNVPTPAPQEVLLDRAAITQWRQNFEIQIGNSLVGDASATATTMAQKVMAYMEQRHGSLDPESKDYRASVQAIGAKLGKPDLDKDQVVWGGGVSPDDFDALIQSLRQDKTAGFGLREKLFACQMWYENVLSPDLIESHAKVQEFATKAKMTVGNIDAFWANAVSKFAIAKNLDENPAETAAPGAPIAAPPGMNAWNDSAAMGSDPRLAEQRATRDPSGLKGTQGRSDMTVKAFTELGGVLSGYELQKLVRLEGKEAEFKALVEGGMTAAAALQELIKRGLGNAMLPWNEGAKAFKPKVNALVSQEASNLPQMAGTSGTTARMMEVGGMLGVASATMLKAMLAMLLPIRAHSFQEVVRGSGVGAAFQGTVDDYPSVVPGCNALDQTGFDKAKRSEAALASGGGGGGTP